MTDLPPPGAPAVVGEALRIVETAKEKRITPRMFGTAAIFQHCPKYGHLFQALGRIPGDIGLASFLVAAPPYKTFVALTILGICGFRLGEWEEVEV